MDLTFTITSYQIAVVIALLGCFVYPAIQDVRDKDWRCFFHNIAGLIVFTILCFRWGL
jgi:hypothetical protein